MNLESYWLLIPAVILALVLIQLILKFLPKPIKKIKPSLPGAGWKIIYTDNASAKAERKLGVVYGKPLSDPRSGLQGKPDFIYSNGRALVPVELKSGKVGESPAPREGDLMQLTAYFYLAEAEYGLRVYKGLLIYSDAMFEVRNTGQLRRDLMDRVREMDAILEHPPDTLDGVEPGFAKCRHCPCRGTVCEYNV